MKHPQQENWKPIGGYEGRYEVSDMGRVKSVARTKQRNGYEVAVGERLLKQGKTRYLEVCLWRDGVFEKIRIHRLVAEAFVPNPHAKRCVNHIDGNKHNNAATNLEWVTHSENTRHAVSTGLNIQGDTHPIAKLSHAKAAEIRSSTDTQYALAKKYGCSQATISNIKKNKIWKVGDV